MRSAELTKGIQFAIAAIVPLLVTGYFGKMEWGISMAVGVLVSSPSDIPGSLRRRLIGVSCSVLMAFTGTLIGGLAGRYGLLFIPALALMVFAFSMISVYGFRASLIGFSGLFAVVLSLAKLPSGGGLFDHALLMGAGGLWYLILTAMLNYLNMRKASEAYMAEGFGLTAQYLDIRNKLLKRPASGREALMKELVEIQTGINEKHELIRETLISRRRNSGRSGVVRRNLLVFMELVDILELSMAHPVNYDQLEELFRERQENLEVIRKWSEMMADRIRVIGNAWSGREALARDEELPLQRQRVWESFTGLEGTARLPEDRQILLVFRNLLLFKDKQYQRIRSIERLLQEQKGKSYFLKKTKDVEKFITPQEYDWKTLVNNLDLKSPIFRHSLRLVVVLVAGFLVGRIFQFQNAYWILLTSLVILRPGYAFTQTRFKERLYGTLIGAGVAVGIVLLVQNTWVYGVLSVVTLVLAFAMVQRNYKTGAAFITLNVVFIYSLLRPDALEVIQFRVLDTVVGAFLAFLGNRFLWPTWEYVRIHTFIAQSIRSNLAYLTEIEAFYSGKKEMTSAYKLARKQAFLAIGELSAAFQRMAQEPGSGKKELESVFALISLNQELLSAGASLGSFIREHAPTLEAVHIRDYVKAIGENLEVSLAVLEEKDFSIGGDRPETEKAAAYFRDKLEELSGLRAVERRQGMEEISEHLRNQFQEVQMVSDQLQWILELSRNMMDKVGKTVR